MSKPLVEKHLVLGAGTGVKVRQRWDKYFKSVKNKQVEWYAVDKRCKRTYPTNENQPLFVWDHVFIGDFNYPEVWGNIRRFTEVAGKFDTIRFDISTSKFADINHMFLRWVTSVLKDDGVFYLEYGDVGGSNLVFTDQEIREYINHIEYCQELGSFITRYIKYIGDLKHLLFQDRVDALNMKVLKKYFDEVELIKLGKPITAPHMSYGCATDYYILKNLS